MQNNPSFSMLLLDGRSLILDEAPPIYAVVLFQLAIDVWNSFRNRNHGESSAYRIRSVGRDPCQSTVHSIVQKPSGCRLFTRCWFARIHLVGLPMDRPPEVGEVPVERKDLIYWTFLDAWRKIMVKLDERKTISYYLENHIFWYSASYFSRLRI